MILISGEALIDLIPDSNKANAYDAVLGGSPYNVAIGLGRLGSRTAFVSRISADGNGEALAAALAQEGVDLRFVARDPRPTTLAFIMHGTAKSGSRYSFYLDGTAYDGAWPFPKEWPKAGRHLHVGSFSAVERHGEAVVEAMRTAHAHATVSFDPNIRPFVTPDRESVAKLVERQASLAHFVKASEEDLMALSGPRTRGQPDGMDETRSALLRRHARRMGSARHAWDGAHRGRRLRASTSSTPSAPAIVSCPPCSRRWIEIPLSAPIRPPRIAANWNDGCASPRPPPRSPARARDRIRRPAPRSRPHWRLEASQSCNF